MRRLVPISLVLLLSCRDEAKTTPDAGAPASSPSPVASSSAAAPATADEAKRFVDDVDKELRRLWTWNQRAGWAYETNINIDTEALSTQASEANMAYLSTVIPQVKRFAGLTLPPEVARQLQLLRFAVDLPPPSDPKKRAELADVGTKMRGLYGKGKYCPPPGSKLRPLAEKLLKEKEAKEPSKEKTEPCLDLEQLSLLMKDSRDWDENLEAFEGWHKTGRDEKALYTRYVELANEGARDIGFTDFGDIWRSGYDMSAADFEKDTERLWTEVKPLYDQLHCYVRSRLRTKYGKEKIPEKAPIPAHILSNMWAQEWSDLYPLVEPYAGEASLDVTKAMKAKKWDELKVVKTAEDFFVGIGLQQLPKTFWERSLFKKPSDREVVCHASAWDVQYNGDVRIKMCVNINEEDLYVAHHELGHDYYYLNYYTLPMLFQSGANDGFHEGIGDTMRLSVTPGYLKGLGLLDKAPDNPKAETNVLMKMALEKVAFLPFGKLLDQWRWDVFSGKIPPAKFNEGYWALRRKYQGIAPVNPRGEEEFDAGAKFHVPANTPYTRYFLATIYQFQFHRALCQAAGHTGPLHTCSIAGSKAAGDKLKAMLALGASKTWQEAMKAITGSDKADATAMLEYFAPLVKFLEEKNKGEQCVW
jgi:peptidyl-dipeptidase A